MAELWQLRAALMLPPKLKGMSQRVLAWEGEDFHVRSQHVALTPHCQRRGAALVVKDDRWGVFLSEENYPKARRLQSFKRLLVGRG